MSEMKTDVEAIGQGPPAPRPAVKALTPVWREVGITAGIFVGVSYFILPGFKQVLQGPHPSLDIWYYVSLEVLVGVFAVMMFQSPENPYLKRLLAGCGLASGVSLTVYEWVGEGGLGAWLFPMWLFGIPLMWASFSSEEEEDDLDDDDLDEEDEEPVPGLAPDQEALRQQLLRVKKRFELWGSMSVLPDIDGDLLATARKTCRVPPDERVVGILDFSGGEPGEDGVVFGCRALFYHNSEETEHAGSDSILYAELSKRSFVNHGKAVYLGNDQFLEPQPDETGVDCEKLTRLLHEVQQLLAAAPPPDKPGAKAEPS